MNVTSNSEERCQKYKLQGKPSMLVCDGGLDHDVWDRVSAGSPAESHDQFVKTLYDPRLAGREGDATAFGPDWKDNKSTDYTKKFILGDPQGVHQEVQLMTGGMSGNEFKVLTSIPGVVQHEMSGQVSFGALNDMYTKEQVVVPDYI